MASSAEELSKMSRAWYRTRNRAPFRRELGSTNAWRSQQIAGKPLDTIVVIGPNSYGIMGRKARMISLPGVQQLDPCVVEQVFGGKQQDYLLPEQKFGRVEIDIGHGVPRPVPATTRADCMNMRMPAKSGGRGVHSNDHSRANAVGRADRDGPPLGLVFRIATD